MPWEPEIWIEEPPVRSAAAQAVARGSWGRPRRAAPALPGDLVTELEQAVGPSRAAKLAERLAAGREAFINERYPDARRILGPLAQEVPDVAAVRELLGLTLYRLERWKQAASELEAAGRLTGTVDHLPVLADCARAQRRYAKVAQLWTELQAADPPEPLLAEGRIVVAGARADQGDLRSAIALLEPAAGPVRRVQEHHLRQWYALADLYDRAGEAPRARALFARIQAHDPDFADVAARLAQLGP